jgi:ribosomal protein S18 acetylase RimI-like enzyme
LQAGENRVVAVRPYDAGADEPGVRDILESNGWEERYIQGQLAALRVLSGGDTPGVRGAVYIGEMDGRVSGYVSVEFRVWNRLGQIQGLAVDPRLKRRGVATRLTGRAEALVRSLRGRGLYVDTPVTNSGARSFYVAAGYREAYTMPEYYDEGLDGVTYLKLFTPAEPTSGRL